ncbi:MAG: hypothetical protein VX265_00350 [Myxococcota bacterium]|nr:hypothetical protein [Myxococcota bacterium]
MPAAAGAEWVTDDHHLIAGHLRPGDVLGEWTLATHAHAADVVGGYLWRPLTSSVYQLWADAFGRTPPAFRVLSALMHLVNIALVASVSRRMGAGPRAAAIGALAFALHPLAPDAVCWISDLSDVLAAFFLLLGLWVALGPGAPLRRTVASALLFGLALLSKEAALAWVAALPGIALLLRGWRPALSHAGALGLVALGHARWHASIVGRFDRSALDLMRDGPFLQTWLDYLWWPIGMPVRAGYTHLVEPSAVGFSPAGTAVLLVLAGALAASSRREADVARPLAVGLGVWAVMVAPGGLAASSFLNQAARYLYLPLAVATPAIVVAMQRLGERLPAGRRWMTALVALTWTIAWTPRTVQRVGDWQSEPALYLAEHAAEPGNPFAGKELGRILFAAGQDSVGIELWAAAVAAPPASRYVMDVQAARLDRAQAAASGGRTPRALSCSDGFLEAEAEAGRVVDPSVHALRSRIAGSAP